MDQKVFRVGLKGLCGYVVITELIALVVICFLSLVLASGGAEASAEGPDNDEIRKMTQRLASLRAEIETLNVEIEGVKKEQQGRLDALMRKKLELDDEKLQENGRRIQAETRIASLQRRASRLAARSGTDRARLQSLLADAKAYLTSAVPIQHEERAEEIRRIEADVKSGEVSLESSIVSLWKWLDQELRFATDMRIASQNLSVVSDTHSEGKVVAAEVLSLGSVYTLFADTEGRFGRGRLENGKWTFRYFPAAADQKRAFKIFEAVRKKASPGFVEVPGVVSVR